MSNGQHWTERSTEDFVHRISFDFVTQIDKALESGQSSQAELAKNLRVTEGRVSQVLNNPGNLGLNSIVKYARAIGRKVAIVLYDDGDATNNNGPVNSEIFSTCWEQAGRPSDFFSLRSETTRGFVHASQMFTYDGAYYTNFTSGQNSTVPPFAATVTQGLAIVDLQSGQRQFHSTSESKRLTVQ
jgi:predicted XRE-type DNA-binding protein